MKKLIGVVCALSLCAALLAGCNSDSSAPAPSSSTSQDTSVSQPADESSSETSGAADTADTEKIASAVSAIEAVNAIPNLRTIDDFAVENDMGLSLDDLIAYQGDVTNNQSDCALVFVAQVKDGAMDTVKGALEAYRDSMTSSLYVDEAAKVAKAEDARIVTSGNFVVMVVASVDGPDYADIDTAINSALG